MESQIKVECPIHFSPFLNLELKKAFHGSSIKARPNNYIAFVRTSIFLKSCLNEHLRPIPYVETYKHMKQSVLRNIDASMEYVGRGCSCIRF